MLTEIQQTQYKIVVRGATVATNIPSRQLAEATLLTLNESDRSLAEILPITSDGKQVLFG